MNNLGFSTKLVNFDFKRPRRHSIDRDKQDEASKTAANLNFQRIYRNLSINPFLRVISKTNWTV